MIQKAALNLRGDTDGGTSPSTFSVKKKSVYIADKEEEFSKRLKQSAVTETQIQPIKLLVPMWSVDDSFSKKIVPHM